ncbi:unnamed protein product, partial [Prorocentrum cordatum]
VAARVRELVALPAFDTPNTERKSRIAHARHGNILLPCEDEAAADLERKLKDAVEANANHKGSMTSPIVIPSEMLQVPGIWIQVEQIISEAIRGMGGDVKMNRAPRNNTSRQFGGGKRRGGKK